MSLWKQGYLQKNTCVDKVQTLVLTEHDFASLSNFLFSLPLLYMELHTHFQWVCRRRRLPVYYRMYLPSDWLNVFLGLSNRLEEYTWTKFKHCLCFNYRGLHWACTLCLLILQGHISAGWHRYFTCLTGSPCWKHATLFKTWIPDLVANKILNKRFSSVIIYQ